MYRFPADVARDLKAGCVLLCVYGSYWFYPLAVLVIGARQRGLSTILHDCAHGVGISNRKLQMAVGTVLTAYPIFQQHYAYKVSHVYTHHPRLGSPDLDPDLRFFIEQGAYEKAPAPTYIRRVVLMPLLGSQTWAYIRYLIRNRYRVLTGAAEKSTGSASGHSGRRSRECPGTETGPSNCCCSGSSPI
jgi:fatty acid desaturase